jgi:hypothetical protein
MLLIMVGANLRDHIPIFVVKSLDSDHIARTLLVYPHALAVKAQGNASAVSKFVQKTLKSAKTVFWGGMLDLPEPPSLRSPGQI